MLSTAILRISRKGVRTFHGSLKKMETSVDGEATKKVVEKAAPIVEKPVVEQKSFLERHAFAFQLAVATGKTAAADLMVQTVVDGKSLAEVDWRRNGIFIVFGAAYLGGFQYWLMVTQYGKWFPTMSRFAKLSFAEKLKDTAGILDAGKMVLFDIFIHLPIMYFPAYYTCKELVMGYSYNPLHWFQNGVAKYASNAKEDLTAMVQLWGPSDCIQFVLPLHIRMPFRHMVSFFWTAYVSFTRGAIKAEEVAEEA